MHTTFITYFSGQGQVCHGWKMRLLKLRFCHTLILISLTVTQYGTVKSLICYYVDCLQLILLKDLNTCTVLVKNIIIILISLKQRRLLTVYYAHSLREFYS